MTRAPLVGRVSELAYLREQYESVAAGHGGRVVLIAGQPGAGKTRLAQEAGASAQSQGGRFLTGQYLRDGTAAYGPWVEALRGALRDVPGPELTELVGPYGPDLAWTVPDLVVAAGPFAAPPPLPPDEQRRRLFDGFAELIQALSRRTPLVLLLDDLHWAPGLSLLLHVARRLGESQVLIIGTYREQEFKEQPGLLREWAELNRLRLAVEIHLHLLSEAETAELIGHYFGTESARQLRGPVYQRTRGNAFFTEEVLRSLAEQGAVRWGKDGWEVLDPGQVAIPESMRLAIRERIDRLGETAREVLVQAAVLGQEFSFECWQALAGLSEDELLAIVARAQTARLLVDRSTSGQERYAFWDDQMQEVLYTGLPTARRRRAHRQAGQVIEAVFADCLEEHLEELARHFLAANNPSKGADYAYQAAEKNERVFNWTRAAPLYALAAQALSDLPQTTENLRRHVDALVKQVSLSLGFDAPQRNLARLAEAESLAQTLAQRSQPTTDRATGGADEDRSRLTRIQYWIGRLRYYHGEYPAASEYFQQVLAKAREVGDEDLAVIALSTLGRLLVCQGHLAQAEPLLSQAAGPLESAGNWSEWTWNLGFHASLLAWRGESAAALVKAEHVLTQVSSLKIGSAITAGQNVLLGVRFVGGDYPGVLEGSRAALEAADHSGDRSYTSVALIWRGWTESRLGNVEAARDSLAQAKEVIQRYGGQILLHDCFAAAEAEIALTGGQVEEALTLAEAAVARARSVGGVLAEGLAERVWGQALTALDPPRWEEAKEHLAASLGCFEAGDVRLEAARTRVVWGQLLRDRGDVVAAREHFLKAANQFEASGLTEELERTRQALDGLGPPDRHKDARPTALFPKGLTAREVAVLQRVAGGQTNKEIAAELVISISTVERHIAHIYAKIGARGRADAVAFALTHGLT